MTPNKPDTNACGNPPSRRTFLQWLTYGLSAVAAIVLGLPVVGYFLGRAHPSDPLGSPGRGEPVSSQRNRLKTFDNPLRQPWDGMTALTGVYVRNLGLDEQGNPQFLVLAVNCAHLGCPVSWFPQSGLFMCPCHGGVYYANGDRASGPPPRGLFRCAWRVREGRLEIQAPHYPTLQDTLVEGDA